MVVTHGPTGKPFATKYAHSVFGQDRDTIDEAWPGDVIGLVNATDVTVGDALYLDQPVAFPRLPEFAPEHFVIARVKDTGRFKQFRRGIAQLDEEGVVQVFRPRDGSPALVGVVGPLQLDVLKERLKDEYGLEVGFDVSEFQMARWISGERKDLDARLMGGAVLFGIGWGIAGLCPGPGLAALALSPLTVLPFVGAMLAGMLLQKLVFETLPARRS